MIIYLSTWDILDKGEGEDDPGHLWYGGEGVLQQDGRQSLLVLSPDDIRKRGG